MTEKNKWGFAGRNIRIEITFEVINNRKKYFITRKYDDDTPDESVPLEFHKKYINSGDPFKLYKEKQKEKEREKEEALNKPVEQTKEKQKEKEREKEEALNKPVEQTK